MIGKKFFIETEHIENENYRELNQIIPTKIANDNIVNDFLNKNLSLESLIEYEIYNTKSNK